MIIDQLEKKYNDADLNSLLEIEKNVKMTTQIKEKESAIKFEKDKNKQLEDKIKLQSS